MSTPTIAHEGNPRVTDALVVTGTLDGTATLLIQYAPQIEERPQVPVPITTNPSLGYTACSMLGSPAPVNGIITAGVTFNDPLSNDSEIVQVTSGPDIYGLCYINLCCPSPYGVNTVDIPCATPDMLVTDLGPVGGNPVTGVFFGPLGSTRDSFTGYAMVADHAAGTIGLYHATNKSLSAKGNLTAIATAALPAIGTVLNFGAWFTPDGTSQWIYNMDTATYIIDTTSTAISSSVLGYAGVAMGVLSLGDITVQDVSGARWSSFAGRCGLCYSAATLAHIDGRCTMDAAYA